MTYARLDSWHGHPTIDTAAPNATSWRPTLDCLAVRERHASTLQCTVAELARALAGGAPVAEVLATLTSAALALIPGADCAKISSVKNGHLRSIAATSQLVGSLDIAQDAAQHGPCLDALTRRQTVRCDDLCADVRWPRFASHATTAGVRSVMSSPIDVLGDTAATLSLFGFRSRAFGVESETLGAMLANHAAIAMLTERRARQFKSALATRDGIGQAKGMIMERFDVDADEAFAMLKVLSQESNTPLRIIAAKVVDAKG